MGKGRNGLNVKTIRPGYRGSWVFSYDADELLYYLPVEKDFRTVIQTIFSSEEE